MQMKKIDTARIQEQASELQVHEPERPQSQQERSSRGSSKCNEEVTRRELTHWQMFAIFLWVPSQSVPRWVRSDLPEAPRKREHKASPTVVKRSDSPGTDLREVHVSR